jgi:hypothetical protein
VLLNVHLVLINKEQTAINVVLQTAMTASTFPKSEEKDVKFAWLDISEIQIKLSVSPKLTAI